jgi:glycosyltransferase involved in cell wall biosynthesis
MSVDRQIRLGMITDRNAVRVGDELWTNAPNGRLIAALRDRSAAMTLAVSMAPRRTDAHDFRLSSLDVDVIEGPYVPSIARGFFRSPTTRRMLRELERRCDVVFVQMPLAAVTALFSPRKPRVYQMAGDVRSAAFNTQYYRGLKGLSAKAASRFYDACHYRLVHHPWARLVAHGSVLLNRYGADRGRCVVSSTLCSDEILSVPRRRPVGAPFRVLYVGFLRHEKGIDVLFEAFRRLLEHVPNAELEIVGEKDLTDHGVSATIRASAEALKQRAGIHLRGQVPFGPELFQSYADADVCVVASRGGEGTPRVLVEARAFGCPVVGTTVSGIPDSIDHERDGLLVPPGDPAALADAILRIANDEPLRRRLIAAGIERARRTTIDDFADAIFAEILLAAASGPRTTPTTATTTQQALPTREPSV